MSDDYPRRASLERLLRFTTMQKTFAHHGGYGWGVISDERRRAHADGEVQAYLLIALEIEKELAQPPRVPPPPAWAVIA